METGTKPKPVSTVFVSGVFNVLHPGHFRFLNFAANLGKRLIVGVLSDKLSTGASVSEDERLENIRALSFVGEAILVDASIEETIGRLKPDLVVKGWEFHNKYNPEKDIIKSYGGRLIFSSGDIGRTGGRDEDFDKSPAIKTIVHQPEFMQHHGFTFASLEALLNKFDGLNICVLGDLIVDRYINCEPIGMSREDPTIVVRPGDSQYFLGAAGIVAAHAVGLGASVNFISVAGVDEAGDFCLERLGKYGVKSTVIRDDSRPTTQKTRYRASGKTLLRVNDYSNHPISDEICDKIMARLQELLPDIDVIIFSDFSYGALPQKLVDDITKLANDKEIILAADSQISSQTGDISRFKNVSLVTPTEHEARHSLGNYADGLIGIAEKMRGLTSAENVVITLGGEGLLVSGNKNGMIVNDPLPALQTVAVDVSGAGDALLVTTALALAAGGSIWEAVYLGSLASAVQVSRVGNVPLQYGELCEVLEQ